MTHSVETQILTYALDVLVFALGLMSLEHLELVAGRSAQAANAAGG